ncbi:MAG: glycosyltransferase family 2 protein [Alphaproteobacteria bacterium]|nr:glycosyltransferase family 2 protein [Alphaproteobacteria bacterium]
MSRVRSQEAPRLVETPPDSGGAVTPERQSRLGPAPSATALSVVVPVHDEQDNIAPLIEEITAALTGIHGGYEIVIVDDGSSDGTGAALTRLARRGLVVVRHRRNYGQSAALLSGVRVARGIWVATLDGDGQNDPADIPRLWHLLGETGDPDLKMIAGHRKRRQDTWLKRMSSRVANGVRGWLLGDSTPDTGCGLKLLERDAFLRLPHFDHFHRFLPALIQQGGGRVASVEVSHRPRRSGRSHYGVHNRLWVGIVDLIGVMWLKRRSGRWHPSVIEVEPVKGDE